ncbi:putative RNA methylase [Pseudarthrobacter siccitolerans]|uniref:RNA methylase n=1 Tax=Pseudarthrobacter siccitolerans TaxID=861266 RepID=A0ABU0PI02_9MICC|nr:rRNA adenine N-6-methyltransferase family protein [Pseudarthrobacter siccitolerans]MDQ0672919.1 putative RNA methylase [Pseudarthrobacter siccitolerans]
MGHILNLSEEALEVLEAGKLDGYSYYLPQGQLTRQLYVEINKILETIGGKWDRKSGSHIFSSDPEAALEQALDSGRLAGGVVDEKKLYQFYETPQGLAQRVVEEAAIEPGMSVLEPSAGRGALLEPLDQSAVDLTCVEIDSKHSTYLSESGISCINQDFVNWMPDRTYDRIIMNPPFTRQQDVDHVSKAFQLLKPAGRLVAITSPGWQFRDNRKSTAFRELVDKHGWYEDIPEGTFKTSGTMIRTVLVVLDR